MGGYANGQSRVSGTMYSPTDTICYRWFNLNDRSRDSRDRVEIYVPGGKFSFDLPDEESVYTVMLAPLYSSQSGEDYRTIYNKTMSSLVRIDVLPGEKVQVESDGNGTRIVSPTYQRYYGMKQVLDTYRKEAERFDTEGLQDSADAYRAKVSSAILDYIRQHPKDPLDAFLIKYEIPNADADTAYNLLDSSLRDGNIGRYVSDAMNKKKKHSNLFIKFNEVQVTEKDWREVSEKVYTDAAKKNLETGDAFPDLILKSINGDNFSINALRGKYVYIDVWATWCGPCIGELPHLKKLEEAFRDKNIAFLSVSIDQDRLAWEEMVLKDKLGGIQLYAGGARKVFNQFFGVWSVPHFILLDRDGKVLNLKMTRPSNPETEEVLRALEGI